MTGIVTVGVDVGQQSDPTAICVAEITFELGRTETWQIRHLEALPLGTPYPVVATTIAELVEAINEHMSPEALWLLIDATGVGQPVEQEIRRALNDCGVLVTVVPVLFRYGQDKIARPMRWDPQHTAIWLGKGHLVSRLQVLIQSGRLEISTDSYEVAAMRAELLAYEIRVKDNLRLEAGAFRVGAHDDLVTALGLATLLDRKEFQGVEWLAHLKAQGPAPITRANWMEREKAKMWYPT